MRPGYLDSVTVYDSLGQAAEAQSQMPGGGWDITDTAYDSSGNRSFTAGPYYAGTITEGAMVQASRSDVADETGTVYDGAGRAVKSVAYDKNTETWETDTAYGGNYTTTSYQCSASVAKCGGTPQTTFTYGRGLKTAIYQYHAGVSADPSDPSSDYDKTAYAYFPSQKLKTITDATGGNQWSYTYDLSGNELTASDPDSGKTTDTYDPANQLATSTDARNKEVSYVYDADGRKTAEYDTTGGASETSSDEIASWTYDTLAKGQLTSSSSYYGGQAYTEKTLGYNAFGEPTGTEVIIPSSQGSLAGTHLTMDKAYTAAGQLQSYQDSAAGGLPAETVNYAYNAAGQPVSANGIASYVNSLSYDELGNPKQYSLGSSSGPAYVTDSYDPQTNALAEQQTSTGTTPATVDDLKYAYDNVGNVLSENNQPAGGAAQSQCFSYDYLGRLATAWSQGSACTASSSPSTSAEGGAAAPYWHTYTYDTTGNLARQTSEQPDGTVTTTTGTFPSPGSAQPHAPASETQSGAATGTTSYSYDPSGHLTSTSGNTVTGIVQSQSLAWDDAGRLSSVTSPSGGVTPSTSYFYGAGGNLLIEKDPGQATLFLPDEQLVQNTVTGTVSGTRYYTIGQSGTSTSSGTAGNASASADSSTSGSTGGGTTASSAASSSGGSSAGKAAAGGIGSGGATVACRTSSGTVDYLVGDQQGTAGLAIDSGSLAVTRRYYDPYGNPVGTPPSSWPGDKGFVGGTASAATGMTNLGAREYQPQTEAFITPDSILNPYDPQNLNAYAYASDNPATKSDPTGQNPCLHDSCPVPPQSYASGTGGDFWAGFGANLASVLDLADCASTGCVYDITHHSLPSERYQRWIKSIGINTSSGEYQGGNAFALFATSLIPAGEAGDAAEGAADSRGVIARSLRALLGKAARGCGESFTPDTKVLLASGKAVPIASLKPGDRLLATNTRTGKTSPQKVAAVEVNHDHDLYNLKVKSSGHPTVVHTTSSHLFWVPSLNKWLPASNLKPGTHLKTPDGQSAVVVGGSAPADHDGWMWDLTVPGNNDHDFYVQAGSAAILVHNETCRDLPSPFGSDIYAVLGRRGIVPEDEGGDINVARPWPGHEVLTLNRWTIQRNDEWVAGVIAKRQPIYLATPIDDASLATSNPRFDQSIFARELNQVLNSGIPYDFSEDGTYLLPRPGHLWVPYDQLPVPGGGRMSKSAELLSRLAEEGYVSRRIPGDCDAEIADFLNRIQSADVFAAVSQDLSAAAAWILLEFADRAASYAVRIQDTSWVGHGVMAAQLAATKIDPREALMIYSILYRAVELLDGDPIGALREAASRAPVQIGDFTIEFALRDDEDKSIAAMGYIEGVDDDGFAFVRTW